ERNAPAEFVAKDAKNECTNRPHHQRERDRERDFGDGLSEIMADRNEDERDEKEIERIERPTKKAGDERVPLLAIERFEKPDRFHAESTKCHVARSRDISQRRRTADYADA